VCDVSDVFLKLEGGGGCNLVSRYYMICATGWQDNGAYNFFRFRFSLFSFCCCFVFVLICLFSTFLAMAMANKRCLRI
jgi:uncharacterized membrane protein